MPSPISSSSWLIRFVVESESNKRPSGPGGRLRRRTSIAHQLLGLQKEKEIVQIDCGSQKRSSSTNHQRINLKISSNPQTILNGLPTMHSPDRRRRHRRHPRRRVRLGGRRGLCKALWGRRLRGRRLRGRRLRGLRLLRRGRLWRRW